MKSREKIEENLDDLLSQKEGIVYHRVRLWVEY
jgi:hypothetical protein